MNKLIILKGVPCSGKSTWAAQYQKERKGITVEDDGSIRYDSCVIVNRDTIRYELGGGEYTMNHEDEVTKIEAQRVEDAMRKGDTVILDSTNLNPKYLGKWFELAEKYNYEVEEKEFRVTFEEAMKRSKERGKNGGLFIPSNVMKGFFKRYYLEDYTKEMTDTKIKGSVAFAQDDRDLPLAAIFDLDGTVALHNGREPFEWDRVSEDIFDERMQSILKSLHETGTHIIFLTGRPSSVREETREWLAQHRWRVNQDYLLYMRPEDDWSSGDVCKQKIYHEYVQPYFRVVAVFEDSQKCIDMWRGEDLLCLAPATNNY